MTNTNELHLEETFWNEVSSLFSRSIEELKEHIFFLPFSAYEKRKNINENTFVVYADWWLNKPAVVQSKIGALLNKNQRVFARKTSVKNVDKLEADLFLQQHHIYGTTKAKHKIGLFYNEELVAIATFSAQRNFNIGRSGELIRFCSKNGVTVVGGLDKLIKFYCKKYTPNHLMTYVDKDWGNGKGFVRIGFKITEEKVPNCFYVNTKTGKRQKEKAPNWLKICNKGSLKMEKML